VSIAEQKDLLSRVARRIFEEATTSSLGATFNVIISFHLRQKFGRDPYEVLLDCPKTFNDGLKEVLGEGAEAVIKLVGNYLILKYNVDCTAEQFVELFKKDGNSSTQRLAEILQNIITREEQRLKAT
jgi:hypothetical protein